MSALSLLRNNRIGAVGAVAVAATAGYAVGSFIGGVRSGLIGGVARSDPNAGRSISFPNELEQNDHYIQFVAKETKGKATDFGSLLGESLSSSITTIGGSIRLPMPSNLSTDYNPEYSTPDLSPATGMALKPVDQAIYGNKSMTGQSLDGNNLQGLIGGALTGAGVQVARSVLSNVPGIGGETAFNAALKVFGGVAVNPHKIVLFTGVNFREHQFSWKLSPRNRRESDAIRDIIDMFTYYSHPEYLAAGLFFKYPEYFEITFRHPEYLFRLQPSVCKDIRVNYHGQGYPAYIRDANGGGTPAPAEVELSLTFMETEIVTKQSLVGLTQQVTRTNNEPAPQSQPLINDPEVAATREQVLQRTNTERIGFQRDIMLGGVGGF